MKKFLFLIAILCALKTNAQTCLISFAGTGESTTVNSVKAENVTTGASVDLTGNDVLRLTLVTGINSINDNQSSELKIYPNPMTDNSTIEIFPPVTGDAIITVSEMTGKHVAQIQSYLENLSQAFTLSGLEKGFYLINVKGNGYNFSGKLISNGKSPGKIRIDKVNSVAHAVKETTEKKVSKGAQTTIDMVYSTGQRIKFTGASGIYSTIKTDIPEGDKTITFNFVACKDGDNNNYPVVEIGTQIWMKENLKTTRYKDGTTAIPHITGNADWGTITTPAYCWYNNNEATYKSIYGALYNWFTVNTGNLCPTGWHVPSVTEWATLTTYLGGSLIAGGKLKETGKTHWIGPNTGATNETGFTALPGGVLYYFGDFVAIGDRGWWWSSTEWPYHPAGFDSANFVEMYSNGSTVGDISNCPQQDGLSVRCLKD